MEIHVCIFMNTHIENIPLIIWNSFCSHGRTVVWWVIPLFGLQLLIWVPKMYMVYGELMIQIIVSPHSLSESNMRGRIFFSPWWSPSTYLWTNMRWSLLNLALILNFFPSHLLPHIHPSKVYQSGLCSCYKNEATRPICSIEVCVHFVQTFQIYRLSGTVISFLILISPTNMLKLSGPIDIWCHSEIWAFLCTYIGEWVSWFVELCFSVVASRNNSQTIFLFLINIKMQIYFAFLINNCIMQD